MKVLALDSSSMAAAVAVIDENKLICEQILNHKKTHSEKLMPMVEDVLKSAELEPEDIDVFAAAIGPGSFTGLRIGIGSIKGMAHALGRPVVGVCTLDGLACNIPFYSGIVCPVMDARSGHVYTGLYMWKDNHMEIISDYMAIPVVELIDILMKKKEKVVFTGDGVEAYKDTLSESMGDNARFAPVYCCINRASSIAYTALQRAKQGILESYMDLSPIYLRKSQAEQAYEKKNQHSGDCSYG